MKQQMKCFALFCFLLPSAASAQIKSGTLIVFYVSQDTIAIAGDSLVTLEHGPNVPSEVVYQCKVHALGQKTIFIYSGSLGFQVTPRLPSDVIPDWTAEGEAHRINDNSSSAPLEKIASFWATTVVDFTNQEVRADLVLRSHVESKAREASESTGRGILANAYFFSSQTANVLEAFDVRITYDFGNSFSPVDFHIEPAPLITFCNFPIGHFCATGRADQIIDFIQLSSERAKSDAKDWSNKRRFRHGDEEALTAEHLVDLGIQYDQTGKIGGKVDVAILRRNGSIKWVANPNCKCKKNSTPKPN